jgi:hypothetical protein
MNQEYHTTEEIERGESGTRLQASPDPRTTRKPKQKVQVACR